ncbi:MAG: PDZ domain-containing protein, partial [bacterium]
MRVSALLALGFAAGLAAPRLLPHADAAAASHEAAYRVLTTFTEAYGLLMEHYVDAVDPGVLFTGALRGMAAALDPHTAWLDPDAVRRFHEDGAGRFAGVGLEVAQRAGRLVVIAPLPGGPAAAAGLRASDHLVAIDDAPTADLTLDDVIGRLRGPPGTPVTVQVERAGHAPFPVT